MPVFTRRTVDGFHISADVLLESYSGVNRPACVIQGSGPSAKHLILELKERSRESAFVQFAVNWGGYSVSADCWNIYPRLWTSYDPCARFSPDLFLDPSVTKFVRRARENEYIYGTRIQAHECPNVYFMEIKEKTYDTFFGVGPILNSQDSMLQAIDVAIRLGFKEIYLSGADMHVSLSPQQEEWVKKYWPDYTDCDPENSLHETIKALSETEVFKKDYPHAVNGITEAVNQLSLLERKDVYSFGNANCAFGKAVMVDHHCRRVSTWLRKARRCLARLGVTVKLLRPLECEFRSRLEQVLPVVTVNDLPEIGGGHKPDYSVNLIEPARDDEPYSPPKQEEQDAA